MSTHYTIFKAVWGWMGIAEGDKGMKKIVLPHGNRQDVEQIILRKFPEALENDTALESLAKIFEGYFKGEKISQAIEIDWSGYSDFSIKVWRATQSIPWGEVRTYKWVSQYLQKPLSSRAIGNALGKNPFPIVVPCHRVVRSDGSLGGFSAPLGVVLKRKMLEMEGIRFDNKGRVLS